MQRNLVQPFTFADLIVDGEHPLYLDQLLEDILARFDINFSVLFASRVSEVLDVKFALLKENPDTSVGIANVSTL